MGNTNLAAGRVLSIIEKGLFTSTGRDLTSFNQIQTKDKMGHFLYFLKENTVFWKKGFKPMISRADLEGPEL
jgi:hypothetical protein